MRKTLDHKGALLAKYPNDPFVRGNFFKYRKMYCKSCKCQRKKYKADLIEKLDNLFENDPKAYWSLLDELKENKRDSLDSMPTPDELYDHFSSLNKLPLRFKERAQEIEENLKQSEIGSSFTKLDYTITKDEIIKCIRSLKNGKSCGLDSIANEMLKTGESILLPCIYKIFNAILQLGIYPTEWKKGYISPIFKSGGRFDPSNYRGITIMTCIGKLFNSVLNNRLDEYLNENKIISETQIGFKKKARTTDHMFVLRTLIEKYTKQCNARLFTCFIDFKKAFDSVLHKAVFLKMQKAGISGLFYNVIKDMYNDNILQLKLGHSMTDEFHSEIGVRQGDTLSPNLFKIFMNGLIDIFDDECDGASLGNFAINCLMYADDVIIISESEQGLHNCLRKLEKYCDLWCLDINIDKTKVIVFNKSGKILNYNFSFNDHSIENVQTYKYLGVLFSASGTFSHAKLDLYNRGLKAFFKLKSIFGDLAPNVNTCLHIFDHTVKPILLYVCEVWGTCFPSAAAVRKEADFKLENGYNKFDCEKLAVKFYKYILGVHKRTTNLAVYGDLGRTPLFIDIVCSIIKYFRRLEELDNSTLLGHAFGISKELHIKGKESWYTSCLFILKQLNIDADMSLDEIKSKLLKRSMELWEKQIHENAVIKNGKMRTYYKFKPFFKKEMYLNVIKNRDIRKSFTRYRVSAHDLEIERGRYKSIKSDNRTCKHCQMLEKEDEFHFLIACPKYSAEREILFTYSAKYCLNFNILSDQNKFLWLMTTEDTGIITKLAFYIHSCFEIRKK